MSPTEGHSLLLSAHGLLSLRSYRAQDHQARNGPTHSELRPPTARSSGGVFSIRAPASQMTLACVNW